MRREYLGVLDDVIVRYHPVPYIKENFIRASLTEELLYGKPGLINDGYLVQHPVLRHLLLTKDTGFLYLLQCDQLSIASAIQPPSASVERRASVGVTSHRELIESSDWPAIAVAIDDLPKSSRKLSISWPSRDMTDGFAALAGRLYDIINSRDLPKSVILPPTESVLGFLDAFLERIGRHHEAPRTQWEALALNKWPKERPYFLAMMDISNLLYHLNISMLLGADNKSAITVVTRDSKILAPLLGINRTDQVLSLPEGPFTNSPNWSADSLKKVLDDPILNEFRYHEEDILGNEATLNEYIVAIGRAKSTHGLCVPPISRARVETLGGSLHLRTIHVPASQLAEHLRLTIPYEFCEEHAATAKHFEVIN